MAFFDFIKEAGEKLFGHKEVQAAQATVAQTPSDTDAKARVDELNREAGAAIQKYIESQGLSASGLSVGFDGATTTATVSGVAADQETKEKIVLAAGNVEGVSNVNDQMSVTQAKPEAKFYTVVKGDTLSKIAKQYYGDANKYQAIFEANKPMLSHPDKIYPGQVLRIPPL